MDRTLPEALVARGRRAIARLGGERLRQSYFITFWLESGARAENVLEEMVLALASRAGVRCAGMEWWIGRAHTTHLPIEFHFDHDIKAGARHPELSSVFFFNSVRGGQLAITDQTPGMREATRLETVKPRRNRYAIFPGNLLHGVLDARGRTPGRPLAGPRGRLRVTLVVNYWKRRPTGVPSWNESGVYRALR